ncbi:cation:proton antiporter [Cereibacter sphaeroides]|uniref:cation:proton antiporter domain-containing protein n=1 Tax=Cereibacter sphaeroides TaxID=1063 RepID=UPI001F39609D|nr:cation:proton antiporter [Cereibacter sphaeroides]MCE6950382.1 cation:proton antiporter [Cereibacter sphaeroides]
MESLLLQASIYLGAALLIVPIAVRAGLGSVLGYLAAGIVMGPVLGLAGAETEDLRHYAEYGVVLMLFLVGLELEPASLWAMRRSLLGLGGLQIVLTALVAMLALGVLGLSWPEAAVLGMVAALSSTAIVLQTLTEQRMLRTPGGRNAFAVLLAQDIAVVPMLALVPLLRQSPAGSEEFHPATGGAAEPIMGFLQSLPGWAGALVTLAVVAGIVLGGHFLTRPVFRYVHASRLPEMGSFIALFTVVGTSFLTMMVGLSPALGTFLAGVVLANSEFRHQLEADIRPYKGILLGLFFMAVGMGIDFRLLAEDPWRLIGLTLGLVAIKALVLAALAESFGLEGRDRWLLTFGLAQAGEFGFVLVAYAAQDSILPRTVAQEALIIISLSMLVTPVLFLIASWLTRLGSEPAAAHRPDAIDDKGPVIIAGIGRFGQVVNRLVRMSGIQTVILDHDMTAVQIMRRFGVKGFFGDPTRPELLQAAGLSEAAVLVVAVDDRENAIRIVRYARHVRPDLHIVARARDRVHVYELFQAGADDIVRETFDSSVRAGRYVLENMGFSEYEAAQRSRTYYRVDRAAMRDLAELWVPGQPAHLNEAYVARARQLDTDLEMALMEEAAETRPDPEAAE